MSADWVDGNNQYLAASLAWLRLHLEKLIPVPAPIPLPQTQPAGEPHVQTEAGSGLFAKFRRPGPVELRPAVVHLLPDGSGGESRLADAVSKRAAAAQIEPPPALLLLAERLNLSDFERDTLLLCAAPEFDPGIGALYAQIQGDAHSLHAAPTFSLALQAFDEPRWDALSAYRPLRYLRLVELMQSPGVPLTQSPLRADERIVNLLKGLNVVDDRLTALSQMAGDADPGDLSPSQGKAVSEVLDRLRAFASSSSVPIVQLNGAAPAARLAVAQQVCATVKRKLYRIPVELLPSQAAEIETFGRLWQRENLLLPVALYFDTENADTPGIDAAATLQRLLAQQLGLVFVAHADSPLRLNAPYFSIEVTKPTAVEQFEAWVTALRGRQVETEIAGSAEMLAGQFDLELRNIARVSALLPPLNLEDTPVPAAIQSQAWAASRELTRPRLDRLAQRLDPKATWDDLVLSAEQDRLLRQIAAQVRARHKVYSTWGFAEKMNRGMGISALFLGESGTGKTMAAEVIANDLQLNLYRIDLSAVVSKYIGETEKNLRKLFDAAEQGGAILFFDEADALFGKRSEVKDSHDRYANIEINYLLQRMEQFSGLAILASNVRHALDPAFMRRLRFIVNFQFPAASERKKIWEQALPKATPAEGIDYDRLSRLAITGGNIHSIALNAAFMAARDSTPVTMPLVMTAARMEMKKLEKPVSEAEFR